MNGSRVETQPVKSAAVVIAMIRVARFMLSPRSSVAEAIASWELCASAYHRQIGGINNRACVMTIPLATVVGGYYVPLPIDEKGSRWFT